MPRKKITGELGEALGVFKDAQRAFAEARSEMKKLYRSFFGNKGTKFAEERINEQLMATDTVSFTKAGLVTANKEQRKDVSVLNRLSENIRSWAANPDTTLDKRTIDTFSKPDALASKGAIAYVNRRLEKIRKAFGEDSAYVKSLQKEINKLGLATTGKGNISTRKSNNVTLEKLWGALDEIKLPEKIVSETIQDLHSESLTSAELRAKTKAAMRNPTEMQNISLIAGAIHGNVAAFNEIVDEFYDSKPDESNIKAYKKYTDIIDSMSHKGILSNAQVEAIITKIADYYRDMYNPTVKKEA